ncbi:Chitinase 1 [Orbilia ellipsospora]|uniref:chitinase n=1 Tax=Orbilia ellipsospora TaxID=2528407 RepID=A0AAV9WV03_9PEZI
MISHLPRNEKIPIFNPNDAQCAIIPGSSGNQVSCPELADDIKYCREEGKKILISLGGENAGYELRSPAEATAAADQIWNTYLGGGQSGVWNRPFGEVEVDGIDLDLEQPAGVKGLYWPIFIDELRSYYMSKPGRNGKSDYLITSSPQCPFPDVIISPALENKRSWFDILFIQFYNNYCTPTNGDGFNFNEWAEWARSSSLNPEVKLFLGSVASPEAASSGGYVPLSELLEVSSSTLEDCEKARVFWQGAHAHNSTYNPFGGISIWDASWTSSEYTEAVKSGLASIQIQVNKASESSLFKRSEEPVNDTESTSRKGRSRVNSTRKSTWQRRYYGRGRSRHHHGV